MRTLSSGVRNWANRYKAAKALVDKQAEDEGLWFIAETAAEAYLQQELRRLHRAIEGDGSDTERDQAGASAP